jgi:hypothetical protein
MLDVAGFTRSASRLLWGKVFVCYELHQGCFPLHRLKTGMTRWRGADSGDGYDSRQQIAER